MSIDLTKGAFVHREAIVDIGARVGARTRVWAFPHIVTGARARC